jgi:hypothetical protein
MNSGTPELQQLRNRIRQFEEHRNRSILRDLELSLQALEYLAAYGRSAGHPITALKQYRHRSGHRGSRKATAQLIKRERELKEINLKIVGWIEENYCQEKMA